HRGDLPGADRAGRVERGGEVEVGGARVGRARASRRAGDGEAGGHASGQERPPIEPAHTGSSRAGIVRGGDWRAGKPRSASSSRSMPRPGRVGTAMVPCRSSNAGVAISRPRASKFTKYSVIKKFGMAAETCSVAASPTVVEL